MDAKIKGKGKSIGKGGKSVDMKKMSLVWCEPMKGRKGEEGRRRGGALKKGSEVKNGREKKKV